MNSILDGAPLRRVGSILVIISLWCATSPVTALGTDKESTKDIVAAKVRGEGFSCDRPLKAVRVPEHSKPDEPVWLLTCENAVYRVTIIADQAARVERLR